MARTGWKWLVLVGGAWGWLKPYFCQDTLSLGDYQPFLKRDLPAYEIEALPHQAWDWYLKIVQGKFYEAVIIITDFPSFQCGLHINFPKV